MFFSFCKTLVLILLVVTLFSFVSTGSYDSWSFERLLLIMSECPDVYTPVSEFLLQGFQPGDFSSNTGVDWLDNIFNFISGSFDLILNALSLFAFLAAGLVQVVVFVFYFAKFFVIH